MMATELKTLLLFWEPILLMECNWNAMSDYLMTLQSLLIPRCWISLKIPVLLLSHKHQRNIAGMLFISIHWILSIFSSQSHYLHFKKKCLAIIIAYIMNLFQRWLLWQKTVKFQNVLHLWKEDAQSESHVFLVRHTNVYGVRNLRNCIQ